MEVKKSPKADLERRKGIFFEIGLVAALAILFLAFEWKVSTNVEEEFMTVAEPTMEEEVIPITQQMLKPPPPPPPAPKLTDLIDIVEDDTDIEEQLEIEDVEADVENREVQNYDYDGEYDPDATGEDDVFVTVEDMPVFPGGDITKWINKHVKYPMIAQENGVQGKVIVQFVVGKDGTVGDIKVVRGVDSSLDQEAVRVIKSMPKWKAGKQRGVPVKVSFTVPINFQLKNQ
ncbi:MULTISPECIES: energy transducer TonB [Sanguibacteroides]|uniref:Energy transducer TonB n=1 Tax=Sanguibacteroides justesenii TaxID=1547597 RepID=A0A0C3RDG7_9PORP|nr:MULTISPECIES: energy transducer TonB [Sanguibacteroides]KIO44286.1 energy transducer TonB [Sanguibacteroides justesenii]KIO45497.1 energy transducer TonB [Sanguibacteroides justesenii]PXZ44782.1 energy transducer TonB [Sanguibacteroides justesenii]